MSRETHVRFCERVGLRCPARLTQTQSAPPARPVFAPLSRAPDNNRRDEARSTLAEIYNWFTEGFELPHLKDAKALLKQFSG